jgi:hypothetical protein
VSSVHHIWWCTKGPSPEASIGCAKLGKAA